MNDYLIAFGSNEGSSSDVFEQAVKQILEITDVKLLAVSDPLPTQPVGGPDGQNAYLNAAIRIQSDLGPHDLHRQLAEIEVALGRQRRVRWGARRIDLDLLLCGLEEIETDTLKLPHPRMSFRRFVIEPANEIASDMVHPTSGQTIGQLLHALNQRENRLLFVSSDLEFPEHEKLIQRLLPTDWQFDAVSKRAALDRCKGAAKLVCYVGRVVKPSDDIYLALDKPEQDRLIQAAVSFPGPTLRLHRDLQKSETEIKAAFDAIKPLL